MIPPAAAPESVAYAISEGYWATTNIRGWCEVCVKPSIILLERRVACVDEVGATSVLIGEHGYCFDCQDFVR